MKFATATAPAPVLPDTPPGLRLPHGLIGFRDYTRFELLFQEDQLPFRWMRLFGPDGELHFVVLEPGPFVPDYEPELFDEDAAYLGLTDSADALLLNIVTVHPGPNSAATINLTGPVVINRRTGLAKQVVLANHQRYSARHPLVTPGA